MKQPTQNLNHNLENLELEKDKENIEKNEKIQLIAGPNGRLELKSVNLKSNLKINKIGIICHPHPLYQGTMDNKVVTTIAKAWRSLHVVPVRFNFRGVGQSGGTYGHGKGELEDLHAVIAWVLQQNPQARLWLGGFSFGAAIAAQAAVAPHFDAKEKIDSLLTVAPAVHHFDFESLGLPACPWNIIQGGKDEIVDCRRVESLVYKLKAGEAEGGDLGSRERGGIEAGGMIPTRGKGWDGEGNHIHFKIIPEASHFFHGQLITLKNCIIELMGLPEDNR